MSDRVPGTPAGFAPAFQGPPPGRPPRPRRRAPGAPLATAAGGLTVTTPFPSIVAEPGDTATFKLTIASRARCDVDLPTGGVPDGWTARFRGGGLTVDSVFVDPPSPADLTLDVEIPDGATASANPITVTATGGGLTDSCRCPSGSATRPPGRSS